MPYGAQYGFQWDKQNGAIIGGILGAIAGSSISLPTMFVIWGVLSFGTYKLASSLSKYYRHKMAYVKKFIEGKTLND